MPKTSSGVSFDTKDDGFWHLLGGVYDLNLFLPSHPGGAEVLRLARDRFADCTGAFLAHHARVERAMAAIEPFRVRHASAQSRAAAEAAVQCPFHAELRAELARAMRGAPYGPDRRCLRAFYALCAAWAACWWGGMWRAASLPAALAVGVLSTWLGAFGHNFVHQPRYFAHARVALDAVGLSATVWRREHVLQHHIYTNTEEDNHWSGTEPFLVVDPRKARSALQRHVFPALAPAILAFGVLGNYAARVAAVAKREESLSAGEVVLPTQLLLLALRHGLGRALALVFVQTSVTGIWYFSLALTNHNAASCAFGRESARLGWAHRQVRTCADWDTECSFPRSVFLWLGLNHHTLHHLFPTLDFCHHGRAQRVLERVCRRHGVAYRRATFLQLYAESLRTFRGDF